MNEVWINQMIYFEIVVKEKVNLKWEITKFVWLRCVWIVWNRVIYIFVFGLGELIKKTWNIIMFDW